MSIENRSTDAEVRLLLGASNAALTRLERDLSIHIPSLLASDA